MLSSEDIGVNKTVVSICLKHKSNTKQVITNAINIVKRNMGGMKSICEIQKTGLKNFFHRRQKFKKKNISMTFEEI